MQATGEIPMPAPDAWTDMSDHDSLTLHELRRRAEAMAHGDLRDLGQALANPDADALRRAIDVLGSIPRRRSAAGMLRWRR